MRRVLLTVALAIVTGCQGGYRNQEAVAEEFLRAAAAGESVAPVVEGEQPMEWLEAIRRTEPAFLQEASADLEVRFGTERDGLTTVEFTLDTPDGQESLGVQFVPRGGAWKIIHVQLTDRI